MEKSSCDWVSLLKKNKNKKSRSRRKANDRKREGVCRRKRREGGEKEVCEEWREGE